MVSHEKLRGLALNTIFEICQYCKTQFTDNEITPLYHYLQTNYSQLATEHASKLVEAAGIVASVQDEGKLELAIAEIAKIPVQMLVSDVRIDLLKSIVVMSALVTAMNDLPAFSIKNSLGSLFIQTWPYCQKFLAQRSGDTEMVEACCTYLQKVLSCLPNEVSIYFIDIQNSLMGCFLANASSNCKCLTTYASLCTISAKQSDEVRDLILSQVD